jgi:hypothetical protein
VSGKRNIEAEILYETPPDLNSEKISFFFDLTGRFFGRRLG